MRHPFLKILIAMSIGFYGCSNPNSFSGNDQKGGPSVEIDGSHKAMLRVDPAGELVLLGSNESEAIANEKPQMKVKLDYGYSLDIHEVTCGDYVSMTEKDGRKTGVFCDTDSLPVVDVSFYDAVLYANARSKAEGFDTVYSYVDRAFSRIHQCIELTGLTFNPTVDGYRLPTEAEWIFAASRNWNPENSWNISNSNGRLHEVCSRKPDEWGFCDLAGNALEWVNDWFGILKDSTVVNYGGGAVPDELDQKVVKGGHYLIPAEGIRLYSRGDSYVVSTTSTGSYLGFRLAFGAIPDISLSTGESFEIQTPYFVEASVETIKKLTGTFRAMLAFRNHKTGNLAFLDYRGNVLKVVEINDSIPVYHPEISPDGTKAAFCTRLEGVSGKSSLYVRNLDAEGSGLVKLDVESAAIPRWYVDENQDTSIVYVDDVGDNTSEAEFLTRGTWKVPFSAGRFGTPEKIMEGAYHGGVVVDGSFGVSGSKRLRAFLNDRHEVWYKEQACNVSLSKAGERKVLFLDFGGRDSSGTKYGVHERLLVMSGEGKLIHSIPAPSGYSFDHSEWVNRENLAVVSLANFNGAHKKVALVNLLDSSVTEILSGIELWHPSFWTQPRFDYDGKTLDLDSVGVYLENDYEETQMLMSRKMRMFWDEKDSIELVSLGSSRTQRGLDPRELSMPALNMGRSGSEIWESLYLAANYVLPHVKNLKYLVLEFSPDMLRYSKFMRFNNLINRAVGYQYDANHKFWKDSVPEGFLQVVDGYCPYTRKDSLTVVRTRGLMEMEIGDWGQYADMREDSVFREGTEKNRIAALDSLVDLVEGTKDLGLHLIFVLYPQSPLYRETGSYGKYGLQRSVAEKTISFLDSLAEVYPHVTVMDENKMGYHDYGDEMANDCDHLSKLGAIKVARRLDSLIKMLPSLN